MNSSPSYTILITGLGALGTVFATLMKKAGHRVFALARENCRRAVADGQLRVTGIWGEHEARLDGIYSSIDPLKKEKFDLIILTVKSYDTEAAVRQVMSLAGRNTLVITAQNGYGNYELVCDAVGRERALLARIIFGAKLHTAGRAEVTVIADDVRIGQPHSAVPRERIEEIAAAFSAAGIPTAYAGNVEAILWDKILYNCALNPLGAILECTYGQLAENAQARRIMDAVIDEIFLVAKAHGIALNWASPETYQEHFYTRLIPPTAAHFPSMYYDVKCRKRLEIDALNGAIVRLARDKNIVVPMNEMISELIKAKEALARHA